MSDSDDDIEQLSVRDEEYRQTSSKTFLTNHHPKRYNYRRQDTTDTCVGEDGQELPPPRNKGVTRVVACVAVCFLLICFGLVGVSLLMSKNIDSIVRNSNEMLKKHNDRMSEVVGTSTDVNTTMTS